MLFKTENYDDIRKYYLGTYIKLKEFGDLLFRIDRVERTSVSGQVEDGREFILYMNQDDPYEIDYVLPHKSYFQLNEDACQLYRIPARQYRRGLCVDNTRVARVSAGGKQESLGDLDFDILKAFVSKQPFVPLSKAVSKECASLRSVVLTPRMAYHRATKSLYIDFTNVASVEGNIIKMKHPIFKAEVQNFLNKTSDSFVVQ